MHTAYLTAVSVLSLTPLLTPASFTADPRVAKTKTPRSLGDILEDWGLNTTLSPLVEVLVFVEHEDASFYTRHQNPNTVAT